MEEEPTSDPDLTRPDVRSTRAAAKQVEFAKTARGLLAADGCPSADDDLPLPRRDRRVPYHRLRSVLNADLASIPHRLKYLIRGLVIEE